METKPVPTSEQPVPVYVIDATARQPNGDGIYCNDLLLDEPRQAAFRLRSTGQIIYGNGVWTGGDDEGNTVSPCASFKHVVADIEFIGVIPYKPAPICILIW